MADVSWVALEILLRQAVERQDLCLVEEAVESIVATRMSCYNERLIASAITRQYESATLPAKQLGRVVRVAPFSEKQQRQSRYDGGVEFDGGLVPMNKVAKSAQRSHKSVPRGM